MTVLQVANEMAQALTGLSLACNIIQSIEFSYKFLTESREAYESNVNLAFRNVAVEHIAKEARFFEQ